MVKKRRMPAHIVLPNGMWRFIKSGSKKARTRSIKVKAKRKRTRGVYMARRSKVRHSKRGMGLGSITLKGIAAGAATGFAAEKTGMVNSIPYGKYIAGAAVGKVAKTGILSGVIGVVAYDMLKGGLGGSTGGSLGNY